MDPDGWSKRPKDDPVRAHFEIYIEIPSIGFQTILYCTSKEQQWAKNEGMKVATLPVTMKTNRPKSEDSTPKMTSNWPRFLKISQAKLLLSGQKLQAI